MGTALLRCCAQLQLHSLKPGKGDFSQSIRLGLCCCWMLSILSTNVIPEGPDGSDGPQFTLKLASGDTGPFQNAEQIAG